MNKAFAAIGAGIIAIFVFLQVFTALGGKIPGMEAYDVGADYLQGPQMRGCMRSLAREGADEGTARAVCECTFAEFDKRGLSLADAFGDAQGMMSAITQQCARSNGVPVPGEEAVEADYSDDEEGWGEPSDDWGE